jgi:hypothetical protein
MDGVLKLRPASLLPIAREGWEKVSGANRWGLPPSEHVQPWRCLEGWSPMAGDGVLPILRETAEEP